MKKITLVLLFCFCAVGFSQAQIESEGNGSDTSIDSKSIFQGILAPPGVSSKTTNVTLTGKSSDLERSLSAPVQSPESRAVINANQRVEKRHTAKYRSFYSSYLEQKEAASQGKVTQELVQTNRSVGPQLNVSSEYGARVPVNGQQQIPMSRVNSGYMARTATGEYTAPTSNTRMANLLTEGFDDITTLAGAGYTFVNASDVIGSSPDWFQGNTAVFDSQAGDPTAYIGVNFNSTAGSEISNWMITPQLNLENGDEITFWTRTVTANTFPDRLEVRLSPDGSTTAPTTPTDVGSYTELLLEINPTLTTGGYPDVWTEFTVTVTGLTGAVDTNVAFRYFVTDAGPTGNNSNYIGIDTLSIDEAAGGGGLELPITFEGQTVTFSDFNGSATQVIANPDASGVNTSDNVAENVIPMGAAFAGVNIVVPVDLTDDKLFTMNVWSPLADTPVLLKLEGGPNPSVEREVMMTTTGAWEDITFDFGSEGAITFDSVTIFMNFNMTDPANQTFYWDNLVQMNGGGGPSVTSYDDIADFQAACSGTLAMEDFSNGPADFTSCGPVMSSAGDGCFPAGELVDGFDAQASNAGDMIFIGAGAIPGPNTIDLVGPTAFADYGIINFTGPDDVFAVGMDIWNNLDPDTDFRVFDTGGALLDSFIVNNAINTENFFGVISTTAIGRIEIEGLNASGELFGNLQFGDCSGGGGGPMACSQENPLSAVAGGGLGSSVDSDFKSASDIVVAAGEDFTIDTIDTYFLTFAPADPPTTATVMYYEDAGGLPGAMIGSETVVPTVLSSQPWANPIADQYEMTMSVTPFTFPGDAGSDTTYWIEVSMGTATNQATVFWEYTNDTPVVGNPAVQFDATVGTWSVPDPTQETVYSYEGECTPMGGGGMACNQDNPLSAVAGGGLGSSVDSDFKTASDIVVTAGEDFTIDTIDTYFLTFAPADPPTTANVAYYEDAGGLPGALIGSETVVPTVLSSQPWANPIADQYELTMSVTPFTFPGDAGSDTTYWIEVSMGTATNQATVFWEYTNDTPVVGNPAVQFDGTVGTWSVPDPTQETVYNYSGECTPIGPGPVLMFPITHESQPVPFSDFNGSVTQQIANPDASGVNTSATVAENVVPANAAFAGVNFIIDVDLTNDKFFAMDVWSPLANTPVLLKLEGGPNPPVERQVNLTTTGAWEEVIFDFSSEGAITFESVTLFMNFNMTDPANQTFYWDNLERLNALPGPANDNCAGAFPIACGEIVAGTTINATDDSAVAPTCDTTVTSPGVWYVYQDTTGLVTDITITMCNGTTDYDSKLSVYTGDCGAPPLTCVVGNDDTCGLQSEVSFQSDGFTTFYILVHGFGGATGNFEIEMICTPVPPPNDMIANSIDVDEIGFPYTDPSVATPAATVEAGSPVDCDNSGARGVWYNFVPEGDGTATATITTPGGGLLFTVNNGPLAGSYAAIAAAFGGEFTTTLITEDTAVILDDDTTGDPNDACDPLLNGADLSGKIAIARRGACAFTDKVIAAQDAGAIAVIVVNNQPGGPIVMGGDNPDITIPALMLGDVDGEAIIAEVLGGGTVNATMGLAPSGFNAVTFYTAPNENAVETDLVLVDWFENQCLPGITASIPTVAGQAYYVYVANHSAITDIVIDGTNLGTADNIIEGFVYYPNPAGGTLNLRAQETIERVAIYNMLGQKVLDQNVNAPTSELNVSELATGTYILQVSVNGITGNYQILKK